MNRNEHRVWTFAKRIHRVGLVLALSLVWLVHQPALLGQFGSDVQYFSQVVLNDGSSTSFTINNPSTTETITVNAQLYSTSGQPLTDGQVELGPGATETLAFGDAGAALTTGWAELKSDDEFIATEFFRLSIGGQLKPRVGVLPSVETDAARFLGFVNPQFKSGLAVTNPSATESTEVIIRARDNAGQEPVAAKTLMLEPLQSMAGFLNEEIFFGTGLSNYEGVVEISVNSPGVAALSLIQEVASGDVATVSVLTQSHVITDESNTALGVGALVSNTEGEVNTAIGVAALRDNTTGSRNTAIGLQALFANTIGRNNTASGFNALGSNTEGNFNTASGANALGSNTTGSSNTATGVATLKNNTTGEGNTASGSGALTSNTEGSFNTASGSGALLSNTTGSHNTANGRFALQSNTTGEGNTATGDFSLGNNTEGFNNTAIGATSLSSNTTGNSNIAIGDSAGANLLTGSNNIYVGNFGAEESNTIRIGSGSHTNGFIAGVQVVPASSRRFKQDIQDMAAESSALMQLRPVTFRYKKEYGFGNGRLQYGLIAEEVAQVYPELVVYDEQGQIKTVEYQKLPAMLLNELQKQHQTVQEQQAVIVELTERLSRLEQVLTAQTTQAD